MLKTLCFCFLLSIPLYCGNFEIRPEVVVAGESVFLSDILLPGLPEGTEDIFVAYSPAPGASRDLPPAFVRAKMRQAGLGDTGRVQPVSVQRLADTISWREIEREIKQAIIESLEKAGIGLGNDADISISEGSAVKVPVDSEIEIRVRPLVSAPAGKIPVHVDILSPSRRYSSQRVDCMVVVTAETFFAAQDIKQGEPLKDKISFGKMELSDMRDFHLLRPGELAGMVAGRNIAQGTVLSKGHIALPVLVRRGDTVKVGYTGEFFQVTCFFEALQNGKKGDTIAVRNPHNNERHRILVTGKSKGEF